MKKKQTLWSGWWRQLATEHFEIKKLERKKKDNNANEGTK